LFADDPEAAEDGFALHEVTTQAELDLLKEIMLVTDPQNLNYGRDVREADRHSKLTVVRGWRVVEPHKLAGHSAKKNIAAIEIRKVQAKELVPQVETKLDDVSGKVGCSQALNEKILLHGTKPELVMSIIQNGLNERLSGGLFGCGIYLAEDPSKINQYVTHDDGADHGNSAVTELHRRLYSVRPFSGGKIYYCFAVRVTLGWPVFTKDGETDMLTGRGLWTSPDKRELSAMPNVQPPLPYHSLVAEAKQEPSYKVKRHREFITFDGDRTTLEYLIAFRRE